MRFYSSRGKRCAVVAASPRRQVHEGAGREDGVGGGFTASPEMAYPRRLGFRLVCGVHISAQRREGSSGANALAGLAMGKWGGRGVLCVS